MQSETNVSHEPTTVQFLMDKLNDKYGKIREIYPTIKNWIDFQFLKNINLKK